MIRLDEIEVERRLRAIDLPALMRTALIAIARGEAQSPPRAAFSAPDGIWFGAMPARCGGACEALGAKLVVAIPNNRERNLPTHRAIVVLFDPVTGEPVAWIEAEALTRARTAAVSVVATQALAARPRGTHAIVGCGAQGGGHLEAFARAGMAERFVVWSRDRRRAEAAAREAEAHGISVRIAGDPDDAVHGADVVTTCTGAAEPLFEGSSLDPGAHVNAIGACVAHKRELPGALVGACRLVIDDLAAARAEAGDIVLAVAEGNASWESVVTLGDVLGEPAGAHDGRVTVFDSLGMGVEDVVVAAAIASR